MGSTTENLDPRQSRIKEANMTQSSERAGFWAEKIADSAIRKAEHTKGEGCEIICASGISPSGSIHLGNFREIITTHIVCEEIRRRGHTVRHIHSWDDYDRLRKIPHGVPKEFGRYIGHPLSDIPSPDGSERSYAEHFMESFENSMSLLGIQPTYIRQSIRYKSGAYSQQVKHALANRLAIFDILSKHQTLRQDTPDEIERRRQAYYPISVYCEKCHCDDTTVTGCQNESLSYECNTCRYCGEFEISTNPSCKLVWKVDWPMRWAYEHVDFEPGGEDHSSPGSSYTVGKEIVKLFSWQAPSYTGYAFVGMSGRSKISSSEGGVPTVSQALDIFESAVLRWLFFRKPPKAPFNIAFGQEMIRIYEEWDRLISKYNLGELPPRQQRIVDLSLLRGTEHELSITPMPLPFRFLTSSADVTCGAVPQMMMAAKQAALLPENFEDESVLYPRLKMAINWTMNYVPEEERTIIRDSFNTEYCRTIPEVERGGIGRLVCELPDNWSKDALTSLLYGIPKTLLGLPMDASPTPEISAAQRCFFVHIYQLICTADTGPRLPTLFHSLGIDRLRGLLSVPPSTY
jgi:lysyl-tRNA synthetase, class I